MTDKLDFLKQAACFPAFGNISRVSKASAGEAPFATNGYLSAMLSAENRAALRQMNVTLTQLALEQCAKDYVATNQIAFGTIIGTSLDQFELHGVSDKELLELSRDYDVVFPWSLQYGNARQPFNYRLVRLPLIVAFPRTVEEVVFWVNFVRGHKFSISIRSGNNSYEGLSSINEIILDLTFLALSDDENEQIKIDPDKKLVHVSPGVRLGVLYTELEKENLALAGGQCAPVCVGGLVGTGGIGFATRKFGWVCDQLEEVEVVLADGQVVVANAHNQYADLYRACKGAGAAGLGVMTRLTLNVVEAKPVLVYFIAFNLLDLEDGLTNVAHVVAGWQQLVSASDDLSSVCSASVHAGEGLLTVFGEYRVEDNRNIPYEEKIAQAEKTLRDILNKEWLHPLAGSAHPLEPDIFEVIDLSTLDAATAVAMLVPMPQFNQWKLKSKFAYRNLTAREWAPVFDYLRNNAPSDDPAKAAGVFSPILLGGASNRIDPLSAAIPVREGAVMWIQAGALWNDEAVAAQSLAFVEGLWKVIDRVVQSSSAFYGSPELELGSQLTTPPNISYVHAYWSSPNHDFVPFLVGVKNKYDQNDLFKFAQSIPLKV